jgi:hypothetical protein
MQPFADGKDQDDKKYNKSKEPTLWDNFKKKE